jgi:hypothetical protein
MPPPRPRTPGLELSKAVTIALRAPRWNAERRARSGFERAAAPDGAEDWNIRFSAFRFLFFRHCEERSDEAIQCSHDALRSALDCFASLAMTASGPDRDEAGHHHRLDLTKVGFWSELLSGRACT